MVDHPLIPKEVKEYLQAHDVSKKDSCVTKYIYF